jgi:hypothetical protein
MGCITDAHPGHPLLQLPILAVYQVSGERYAQYRQWQVFLWRWYSTRVYRLRRSSRLPGIGKLIMGSDGMVNHTEPRPWQRRERTCCGKAARALTVKGQHVRQNNLSTARYSNFKARGIGAIGSEILLHAC